MDNFTIFNMQTVAGLLTFYFAFKWFVFPKLAKLSIYDALVPMVLIHGLRYLGMVFMVDTPGQTHERRVIDFEPKKIDLQSGVGISSHFFEFCLSRECPVFRPC